MLDLPDFYFTGDDYRYRFEPEAKRRILDLLRERFNSGVCIQETHFEVGYSHRTENERAWPATSLAELADSTSEPSPTLSRVDCQELRKTNP